MRKFLLFAFMVVLTACGDKAETPCCKSRRVEVTAEMVEAETKRINEWFEAKFEEQLQFSPMRMSFMGRKDKYDQVDDASEEAEDEQLEWQRQSVLEMEREFDYAKLSEEAKISFDIWKYQYDTAALPLSFAVTILSLNKWAGPQSFLPTFMMNFHKVEVESDMQAYISRLSGVATDG